MIDHNFLAEVDAFPFRPSPPTPPPPPVQPKGGKNHLISFVSFVFQELQQGGVTDEAEPFMGSGRFGMSFYLLC